MQQLTIETEHVRKQTAAERDRILYDRLEYRLHVAGDVRIREGSPRSLPVALAPRRARAFGRQIALLNGQWIPVRSLLSASPASTGARALGSRRCMSPPGGSFMTMPNFT